MQWRSCKMGMTMQGAGATKEVVMGGGGHRRDGGWLLRVSHVGKVGRGGAQGAATIFFFRFPSECQ